MVTPPIIFEPTGCHPSVVILKINDQDILLNILLSRNLTRDPLLRAGGFQISSKYKQKSNKHSNENFVFILLNIVFIVVTNYGLDNRGIVVRFP